MHIQIQCAVELKERPPLAFALHVLIGSLSWPNLSKLTLPVGMSKGECWMPNIFQYITHFLLISCASMFQFQFNGCHPQLPFSFHLQLKTFGDGENELSILQAAAFWRRGI